MKDYIIELLFNWLTTPIIHLNLAQIFIAFVELVILMWIILIIMGIINKLKNKKQKNIKKWR